MAAQIECDPLTQAQSEVMLLLASGLLGKEIADTLKVSQSAVKDRINRAKDRLEARTTVQAVARYLSLLHTEQTNQTKENPNENFC